MITIHNETLDVLQQKLSFYRKRLYEQRDAYIRFPQQWRLNYISAITTKIAEARHQIAILKQRHTA